MAAATSGRPRPRPLPRRFYLPDAREVAPQLLNKVLVKGRRRARIVEVEAYVGGGIDPGSHAFGGLTRRNSTMFGPPGHLYVYFTYGMHWCANVVCEPAGTASAVLLRAVEPLDGLEEMRSLRPRARSDLDLCSGPAKLCQAFSITGADDGSDLVAGVVAGALRIVDDGTPPPDRPTATTRIGLSAGADLPWRWLVPGSAHVSRRAVSR
ncbi:MAG: DNA-3-methyladenine glycosylase [Actinobacteria bacterium]|nr:DNA-3-methyladenine glycosylase [Actinomycetota bacterium]MBW3649537.1 DNA-3-methyladenine glycosylase [Actinomycetota bacterium]